MSWYKFADHIHYDYLFLNGYRLSQAFWDFFVIIIYFGFTIEWWIMHFIIQFEKGYTLDEINFLHNNTGDYIEKEKKLRKRIMITGILFATVVFFNNLGMWFADLPQFDIISDTTMNIKIKNWFSLFCKTINVISTIVGISISIKVYHLMKQRHHYEFRRTRKTMMY